MKVDWKGLVQGMYNSALGKKWVKQLAKDRNENFCKPCEYNSKNVPDGQKSIRADEYCTACGCNIAWKTHQLSSSCPLEKWKAELTQEEAELLHEQLKSK